jgi:hypothetical protein
MVDKGTDTAADVGNRIIQQLGDVQARDPVDLRNDLVGARLHAEVIDIAAAQQAPRARADLTHGEPELRRLVAVDFDDRLRQIVFEVGIEEHEHAALVGGVEERRETSFKRSAGSVVLMANCTGKPKEPGSEGCWNTDLLAPQ